MSKDDLRITPLTEVDLPLLAAFMREQNAADTDPEKLRHWYLDNPAGSSSVMIGRIDDRIVGMSTTNDHAFVGPGGRQLVAMPQKVLTDQRLRGKGIFQQLYHATEEAGRAKGVGFFLTVTNAASTPIFLGRFGYVRLPVPRALAWLPAFGRVEGEVRELPWSDGLVIAPSGPTWRMVKDAAHYRWRYSTIPHTEHRHRMFTFWNGAGGHIVLKRIRRKGVPVMLLLDLVATDREALCSALLNARRIAGRSRCMALLALRTAITEAAGEGMTAMSVSSGFNLLVKGLDEAHTRRLAAEGFELAFGDLDFL